MAEGRLLDVPGARRHVFPGVAHMVSLERQEELARLLLDLLADVEAGRGVAV